jgi:hypothetical protein
MFRPLWQHEFVAYSEKVKISIAQGRKNYLCVGKHVTQYVIKGRNE